MTTRFLHSLIMALLTSLMLKGQNEPAPDSKPFYGGMGHFSFSAERINLQQLNTQLRSNDYGSVSPYTTSFGGGGHFAIHNFMVGGGGAWLTSTSTENTFNRVNLKGSYGYFSFGYIVYKRKHALLYPTLGIGGGGYKITVSKKDPEKNFTRQLNSPQGTTTMNSGGWLGTAQLSYQYFFNRHALEGFFVGLRSGYRFSPYYWKTTGNDGSLINAPQINMNGFFLSLFFGGGSLINK